MSSHIFSQTYLKMSNEAVVIGILMVNSLPSVGQNYGLKKMTYANIADPDQTAPSGAV